MKLYIDCEFNGGRGSLISMALVAYKGREFYEVVTPKEPIDPWVFANVIPVLNKLPVTCQEFQDKLFAFLDGFTEFTVVADHPADLVYFADALLVNNQGRRWYRPWKAECLVLTEDYVSNTPHNALEDARAIARMCHD